MRLRFWKRTPQTRATDDVEARLSSSKAVAPPRRRQGPDAWSLESIRKARDLQLRGVFELPVRMAEAFRTDDAMFTAYQARVATQSAIRLDWRPQDSDAGRALCDRMRPVVRTPQHIRESILGTLANHGLAIGYVHQDVVESPAGPTLRYTLCEWPLEFVKYQPTDGTLTTRTLDNLTIPITHGDGRWIVFRKFGVAPWTQDACVLPGAFLWAAHASGLSDWAGSSYSHGQVKVVGTLAEGLTAAREGGELSPQAQSLLNTLVDLASGEAPAGVLPFGAEAKLLTNGSTAWQVFDKLTTSREKAALRIYCGTDAALGAQGGAPGVDINGLFGIAATRIQGDFEALERGYREGMVEPWCRAHGADLGLAPAKVYEMPDVDGDARSEQEVLAVERLNRAVKAMKEIQLDVPQSVIDALAQVLSVSVPTVLAAADDTAPPIELAPTDKAKVIRVREARAAIGLLPFGDERDDMTITELDEAAKAKAAPPAPAPGTPPGEEPPAEPAEMPAP